MIYVGRQRGAWARATSVQKSERHEHPSPASLGARGIGFRRGRPPGPFQDLFLGRNVFLGLETAPFPWAIDDKGSPAVLRGRHSH